MAIGTALAIGLGSAVLGGGASVLASSKNSKAINRATEAQTVANDQSVALQRDIYGQNQQALAPFMQRGNAAGNQMNALLGLGGPQQPQQAMPQQPNAMSQFAGNAGAYNAANPNGFQMDMARQQGSMFPASGGDQFVGGVGPVSGFAGGTFNMNGTQATPMGAQNAAFDNFRNSTGYQFRLGEGMNALNSGYAGAGVLQSGDAMRAATEYGQNFASNEFGNYAGLLANQQGVGLAGASALAGVGQNYANNITGLNMQNANAIGNQAVARANNSNALIGSLGGIAGGLLGQFGGGR